MIVYFNNRFIQKENVRISPDDRGFLFADGAYEVVRAYGGELFEVESHFKRMERSLRELRIEGPAWKDLREIADNLISRNDLAGQSAMIYVQVTRGVAPRMHHFPEETTPPTVYGSSSRFQPPDEEMRNGIKIILVPDIRWSRCDIKSTALLPNILANQRARDEEAGEAVFVRDGVITEGSHTNLCAVFGGELVTHPKNNFILAGITRGIVLDLCGELKIPFREFPIPEKDLESAHEIMVLSTRSEITPVIQVNGWKVGNGKPGAVTTELQRAFRKLTGQIQGAG